MNIYIVTYKTKNEHKNKKEICNGARGRDERENWKENKNIVTNTLTLWRLMVIYLS